MTQQDTTPQEKPVSNDTSTSRVDTFRDDVAALDVPTSTVKREAWLLWGGIALVVIGIVVVFAGYWGASGTANVADQMPYVLSGGGLGLALVIIGSVLVGRYSMARLFRYWLALLVAEHRTQTDRLVDAIQRSNVNGGHQ